MFDFSTQKSIFKKQNNSAVTKCVAALLSGVLLLQTVSCTYTYRETLRVDRINKSELYRSEDKAEVLLRDGSLVIYPDGFTAYNDTIRTAGFKIQRDSEEISVIDYLPLTEIRRVELARPSQFFDESLSMFTGSVLIAAGVIVLFGIILNPAPWGIS